VPKFFFHLQDGPERLVDEEGLSLPDVEAAWYQVIRSGRELISHRLAGSALFRDERFQVEDETGCPVIEMPVSEIALLAT